MDIADKKYRQYLVDSGFMWWNVAQDIEKERDVHGADLRSVCADRDKLKAELKSLKAEWAEPAPVPGIDGIREKLTPLLETWRGLSPVIYGCTTKAGMQECERCLKYVGAAIAALQLQIEHVAAQAVPTQPVTDAARAAWARVLDCDWGADTKLGRVLHDFREAFETLPTAPDLAKLREAWEAVVDEMRSDIVDSRSASLMSLGIAINSLCPPIRDLQ